MFAPTLRSGFRTLHSASAGAAVPPPVRPTPAAAFVAERWTFEASVDRADAVFLALEGAGRASRWTPMNRIRGGLWSLTLPLSRGRLRTKLYAQRGTTLIHCGGGDLVIRPPANATGEVRVAAARLAWSA